MRKPSDPDLNRLTSRPKLPPFILFYSYMTQHTLYFEKATGWNQSAIFRNKSPRLVDNFRTILSTFYWILGNPSENYKTVLKLRWSMEYGV